MAANDNGGGGAADASRSTFDGVRRIVRTDPQAADFMVQLYRVELPQVGVLHARGPACLPAAARWPGDLPSSAAQANL